MGTMPTSMKNAIVAEKVFNSGGSFEDILEALDYDRVRINLTNELSDSQDNLSNWQKEYLLGRWDLKTLEKVEI